MNPDRQQAIEYLRAPAKAAWRWAENGTVLVWRDGTTVAFREELVQILEWLAPNGLPPFGALVYLLAACRGKVPTVADIAIETNAPLRLPLSERENKSVLLTARVQVWAQVEAALGQLVKVTQLPAELNAGLMAKCVLAEAVFEPAKAERHVEARTVLSGLRAPMADAELCDPGPPSVKGNPIRQVHIVAEGLKHHTAESLALRLRTGLDALPDEIDVALPTAERARRLIEELSRDREFGAVARAARDLMAAVRLPRRLAERDQLAIGGVADITNRGPLDRLLLSELAHDDLTLAVRVALNEALYLRREPPMREPPGTLALLLDSGVRLWGVPRVLGTAVALALIACDKPHREVRAWRAHGKALQPVELLSRPGLVQHLGALEVEAHPGDAVPAFAEAVSSDAQNQSVLITHPDALADPELRRVLTDHPTAPGYVATVDRDGRFELHALPLAHRPPLCAAEVDLASVFDEKVGVPPIRKELLADLPAIFGLSPFPFLLPVAGRLDHWITAGDGITCAVFNDRRLVRFRDYRSGARVLATDLPSGRTLWMDGMDGAVHVVKASASQRPARLLTVALSGEPVRVTELLGDAELLAVHRYGEVILAIRRGEVYAHALSDGRMLTRVTNPLPWVNGRFFRGEDAFYFAAWNGTRVKIEPVTMPKSFAMSAMVHVFDRDGMEGPWFVQQGGLVFSSVSDKRYTLPMPPGRLLGLDSVVVSRDGHQVAVSVKSSSWGRVVNLLTGATRRFLPEHVRPPLLGSPPPLPAWNLYRTVEATARLQNGLALCGRKGQWHRLTLHVDGCIRIRKLPPHELRGLEKTPMSGTSYASRLGCSLRIATWPDGSQAFFDSRGLLHLKSFDRSLPEVSLVLSEGEVAGWTSDGHVCGPAFFFDGPQPSEPARVFERIVQFLRR